MQGLAELRRCVDTMILVPNDRLLAVVPKGTSFRDALKKADEVLLNATQGISDLISVTGEVNVDFADVRTVMAARGPALMGSGFGDRRQPGAGGGPGGDLVAPPRRRLDRRRAGRPDQHHGRHGPRH